jgi:hypothetical protein
VLLNDEVTASPGKINGKAQQDSSITPDLTALVAVVLKEHEAAIQGLSFALEHAMACGDALLKVQESLPHGRWLSFLKRLEDQPGAPAERTALRYVQLAKNRALIMARLAALKPNSPRVANLVSARQAVALIPKPPRPTRSATTPRPRSSPAVTTTNRFRPAGTCSLRRPRNASNSRSSN